MANSCVNGEHMANSPFGLDFPLGGIRILTDQEAIGGMPFIWLDDDGRLDFSDDGTVHGGMFAQAKRLTRNTPSLFIAPNRYRGITPGHIKGMREWLSHLTVGSQ